MQLRGLADIAQDWGGGYADITTRANFEIREIAPRNMVKCILKLQEIGLTFGAHKIGRAYSAGFLWERVSIGRWPRLS